ncbi:heme-degrading protein [Fluviicoccus keumensis]|uniref:Heme-degrading protein n=2 Tax=Fluviicoccus keumensis TaxID=1435465 RepID=A0A4Q7YMM3_9GAMM|nr:heme-degrading protein [Fluviicoccus keumensis]
MKTLTMKSLLLAAACSAGAAQAFDCVDIRDSNQREACYKNSADDHWRNSSDYQRIQEYNAQQREAERRAAEQRRLEQDPAYQARLREEAKARAEDEAKRAKAAEAEAYRQWFERMDREEADKRYWAKEKAAQSVRLKKIRQRVNDRLEAEVARIFAPGAAPVTADDYDRLVTLSLPEWDLMRYWADQGLQRFPREFAFRHAVVQTIGCAGKTYAENSLKNDVRCPLPDFPFATFMQTGEASPRVLDRAVACGLRYLKLENFSPPGSYGTYLGVTPAMMAPWLADEAKLMQAARECEKALPAGVQANPELLKRIAGSQRQFMDEPHSWDAYRRWLLVSAGTWNGLDLGNPEQVEEGMKRLEAAYHQGAEGEWGYFRD